MYVLLWGGFCAIIWRSLCEKETNSTEIFLDNIVIVSSIKESTCLLILPPSGFLHKWEKGNSLDPTPVTALVMHVKVVSTQRAHFLLLQYPPGADVALPPARLPGEGLCMSLCASVSLISLWFKMMQLRKTLFPFKRCS